MLPTSLSRFPAPPPEAVELSEMLSAHIRAVIQAAGGWIPFDEFMRLALYAPGLGYYSAGSVKLGAAGDFVTAPELGSLFGRTLAAQLRELVELGLRDVVELGAGSGALAVHVLSQLERMGALPASYSILEPSADLAARQRERIASQSSSAALRIVRWTTDLPRNLTGVMLANEVLDAIPTHVVRKTRSGVEELGVRVSATGAGFERTCRPASGKLLAAALALDLPEEYETEINLGARALVKSVAERVDRGVALFIDYGFPAREYYHPQRSRGTLMCHYRHHAHDDPLALPGLQDITAHVDFTAIADAALESGLTVLGYTAQAQFLVNCGITELLAETPANDVVRYAPLTAQAHKLLAPHEMGELFKVIALGRGLEQSLIGFATRDRTHTLG